MTAPRRSGRAGIANCMSSKSVVVRLRRRAARRPRERRARVVAGVGPPASSTQRQRPVDAAIEPGSRSADLRPGPGERQTRQAVAFSGIDAAHEARRIDIEIDPRTSASA